MVEDIIGCKWSLCVLDMVSRGVNRPGAMQKSIAGLTPFGQRFSTVLAEVAKLERELPRA